MVEKKIQKRRATLFFGALTKRDLFCVEEMEALAREQVWFRYVPALSQEPEAHTFPAGLVTDIMRQHYSRFDNHEAYLCGSPGMIDACVEALEAKGLPKEAIYYDKFS